MLIRSDISVIPSDFEIDNDILEVQEKTIQMKNSTLQIINMYNPNGSTPHDIFNKYFRQLSRNFVLVGDFNARHQIWSTTDSVNNVSGNALAKILQNYDNVCLNSVPGLPTYIHSSTGKMSVLDLCFASRRSLLILQSPLVPVWVVTIFPLW